MKMLSGGPAPDPAFSGFLCVSAEALVSSAGLSGSWKPPESPWLAPLWAAHGRGSNSSCLCHRSTRWLILGEAAKAMLLPWFGQVPSQQQRVEAVGLLLCPVEPWHECAQPPGPRGFLMALRCSSTTQSRSDPHTAHPLAAWQQLPQLRVWDGIPALASLDTFQHVVASSLALGTSGVASGSSCWAQLRTGVLAWRGMCCPSALGCVGGSRENAVGGSAQAHGTAEVLENRRAGGQLPMAPPWGWACCQAGAELKVREAGERSPEQARCPMAGLGTPGQGERSWNGRSSRQLGLCSVHRHWVTSAGVLSQTHWSTGAVGSGGPWPRMLLLLEQEQQSINDPPRGFLQDHVLLAMSLPSPAPLSCPGA